MPDHATVPADTGAIHLADLPRLSDDDRQALDDGYAAIEGVPAPAAQPPEGLSSDAWAMLVVLFFVVAVSGLMWAVRGDSQPSMPKPAQPEQRPDQEWAGHPAAWPDDPSEAKRND